MMKSLMKTAITSFAAGALIALAATGSAFAMPTLKSQAIVHTDIVTGADLFDNAGAYAEEAMFRAPKPGTAGDVTIEMVKMAANRIGIDQFDPMGLNAIRVARSGVLIGQDAMNAAIAGHLLLNGVLRDGMQVNSNLATQIPVIYAETGVEPLALDQFNFFPANNSFSARFRVAGHATPINVSGSLFFTIEVPHLARSIEAGEILKPTDITMRPISAQIADTTGILNVEQLIGKQTRRPLREGLLLRASDVDEPTVIARNETITVVLQHGSMTLTVKGQALSEASAGETISVLNLMSNRVISGIATAPGVVQIPSALPPTTTAVASL